MNLNQDLPNYTATLVPIYWEPILASGERLAAILVAAGDDGMFAVSVALKQSVLKVLYPKHTVNAAGLLAWAARSAHEHLKSGHQISTWLPPLSGFYAGDGIRATGLDIADILDQGKVLYCSLSSAALDSDSETEAFLSLDSKTIQKNVLDHVRRLAGLQAESIIVDGGMIEIVSEDTSKHILDIPIKSSNHVGAIVSAWYKSPNTVVSKVLFAQTSLLAASERGKYSPGIFIARPFDGIPKKQLEIIDNQLDFLSWSMNRSDISVHVSDSPEILAEELCEWTSIR